MGRNVAQVHLRFSDVPDVSGGVELTGSFLGGVDPESRAHRIARAIIGYVDRHMQRLSAPKETIHGDVAGEDARIEMEIADEPAARALKREALREHLHDFAAAFRDGEDCESIETRIFELVGIIDEGSQ